MRFSSAETIFFHKSIEGTFREMCCTLHFALEKLDSTQPDCVAKTLAGEIFSEGETIYTSNSRNLIDEFERHCQVKCKIVQTSY